ncbi:hypothetical protein SAMN06265218_11392 [Fodinibius sediminis]|uniref:Uncharacterized protein n=1 Tax=Fodinibius sediminis TaxID=1214077 RepID=A0A521E769_9BACT|nr:hypothetical protein SAMN06265218_11392 [Fodinibius sediminis]
MLSSLQHVWNGYISNTNKKVDEGFTTRNAN